MNHGGIAKVFHAGETERGHDDDGIDDVGEHVQRDDAR